MLCCTILRGYSIWQSQWISKSTVPSFTKPWASLRKSFRACISIIKKYVVLLEVRWHVNSSTDWFRRIGVLIYTQSKQILPEVVSDIRPLQRRIYAAPHKGTKRVVAFLTTDTVGASRVLWEQICGSLIGRCWGIHEFPPGLRFPTAPRDSIDWPTQSSILHHFQNNKRWLIKTPLIQIPIMCGTAIILPMAGLNS